MHKENTSVMESREYKHLNSIYNFHTLMIRQDYFRCCC